MPTHKHPMTGKRHSRAAKERMRKVRLKYWENLRETRGLEYRKRVRGLRQAGKRTRITSSMMKARWKGEKFRKKMTELGKTNGNIYLAIEAARMVPRNITEKLRASARRTVRIAQAAVRTPSKIQLEFFRVLHSRLPILESDCLVKAKGHFYHPDIVNPSTKRIVEIDGSYWHDAKKDALRDSNLRAAGWAILRLPAEKSTLRLRTVRRKALRFLKGL